MTDHRLGRKGRLSALSTVIAVLGMGADDAVTPVTCLTPEIRAALARISPNSLRGHLSFLSSDLLEGRDTPSRGLDLAAEYIAAQFRRAALEAIGDDGYFQTANWQLLETGPGGFSFEVKLGNDPAIRVGKELVSLQRQRAFTVSPSHIYKLDAADAKSLEALTRRQIENKAVFAELPPSNPRN